MLIHFLSNIDLFFAFSFQKWFNFTMFTYHRLINRQLDSMSKLNMIKIRQ